MRDADPAARRGETLAVELTRAERAIARLVDAYQDEQITLDELRARMPELRRRESALRAERDAIEAEIDDAANYLKLAETIESFTSRLTHGLDEMDTHEQARILRLLVRDVLIGGEGETVTIRHSIPVPSAGQDPETPLHTVRHGGSSCPLGLGLGRPERSQPERTGRENRHSNFYGISDNLVTTRSMVMACWKDRLAREAANCWLMATVSAPPGRVEGSSCTFPRTTGKRPTKE